MRFAGKFALHRRRDLRVIRLRSPSGFAFLAFPLEILRAFGHIVNARASGFAILAFSLEILRALGHIVNARAPLNLAKSGESIGRAGRGDQCLPPPAHWRRNARINANAPLNLGQPSVPAVRQVVEIQGGVCVYG